uniref:CBM20 domain-containing protein n=1 Tax=Alexandrium monilatum TaxID=311494 RepID=A0A7S4PU10_9DINO
MPVGLWLECVCESTDPGEELLVVGSHAALGNWQVERGVALTTSSALFPRWTLSQPLRLAEEPSSMPPWIEYKYVVRDGRGGCRWEELGTSDMPVFSSTSSAATSNMIAASRLSATRPVNRRLPGCGLRFLPVHMVLLRLDRFANQHAAASASYRVAPDWAPGVAGRGAAVGQRCSSTGECGQLPPEWRCVRAPSRGDSVDALASRVFAQLPRDRLRGSLVQLARDHHLPAALLRRVMEYLGGTPP